jgi:hypothetical protein
MVWQLGDIMHDEQDFLAAHGCTTTEEYDRTRFFEWVDAMEDSHTRQERMVVPRQRHKGVIIQPIESVVRVKPKQMKFPIQKSASQ